MKVSVVIPLYNKALFVRKTLESVLQQDYNNFEVIVVNDGSNDGSLGIANSFADRRLTVIDQENLGVSAARNRGIRASSGEWVAFLDADDYWTSDHLCRLMEAARDFPTVCMISGQYLMNNDLIDDVSSTNPGDGQAFIIDFFSYILSHKNIFQTSCILVRRDVFNSMDMFVYDPPGEDIELWARIALYFDTAVVKKNTVVRNFDGLGIMANIGKEREYRVPTECLSQNNLPTPVLQMLYSKVSLDHRNYSSAVSFFNHRLFIGMKEAFRRGDFRRVTRLFKLRFGRIYFRMFLLNILCLLILPFNFVYGVLRKRH